jgi:two-component system, sensor histidine kinase
MNSISSFNLLLAEDNLLNQRVASLVLKQMGVQFDIASNGKEAVELAIKKKYDLILMDIHMPVVDGLDATRQIREFEKETNISLPNFIVALSATEVLENRGVCILAGMDEFIEKPIKENVLRGLISRTFE